MPLSDDARVIDVGCGDGFYTGLFADGLGPTGKAVGLDTNQAFLDVARDHLNAAHKANVEWMCNDLQQVAAIRTGEFDLVWCAQSLYSLADPHAALLQMRQLARPGGIVGVLENDTLHQLLLPWSSRMELALRAAERKAFEATSSRPNKFYIGRRLPAELAAAGLEPLGYRTQAIDRVAPLEPALELFLRYYFQKLLDRVSPYLESEVLDELAEVVQPQSDRFLAGDPHFAMTWLNVLAWGRRAD